MKPAITLLQAMIEERLFGTTFSSPSFWTWKVVAKLIDGKPLTEQREIELFRACTGRTKLPTKPVRRAVILAGRRAGKDRFLSSVAIWRAALCANWKKHISAGEQAVVILLGADKRQASILRRYAEGLLQTPLLANEVRRRTDDVIEFSNGAMVEIATNDARLVRGRSAICVLGSEAAHWKTSELSSSSDEEVVSAAEPSMAMCPDGGLLLLGSSVHRKRGYMYRRFKQLHGNDDADDLCWYAPSTTMNPSLPQRIVDDALAADPYKAGAEYLGRWREDIADFVPLDVVEAATDFDVRERPPQPGIRYFAFADAAGGTGKDSFGLACAHCENDAVRTVKLDLVRERKPRFVPAVVITELAQVLRAYGISEIWGDGFAGGFHLGEWQRNGIIFRACENTTSENYLHMLPMLLSGRVRLINNETLRSQLTSLERVTLNTREQVRHPQIESAHDDVACAASGALVMAGTAAAGLASISDAAWTRILDDVSRYRYDPPPFSERQSVHFPL
jgi:hypothetical protein